MEVKELYGFVLLIVLIGMLLGVAGLVLVNFMAASAVTGTVAETMINDTLNAISPIATTWIPLIVTIAALAIILVLVIRSFAARMSR